MERQIHSLSFSQRFYEQVNSIYPKEASPFENFNSAGNSIGNVTDINEETFLKRNLNVPRAALFVQTYHRRLMSRLIAELSVVPEMTTRGRGRPAPARKAPAFWRGSRQGRAERRRTLWPAWCKRPGIHRRYASKHFDIVGGIAAASSVRRIIRLNYLPVRSMADVRHLLFNTAEASHEAALPAHLRFYFVRH